jgi:hypothetical protein
MIFRVAECMVKHAHSKSPEAPLQMTQLWRPTDRMAPLAEQLLHLGADGLVGRRGSLVEA